jgi:hypothetical protein
MDKIQPCPTPWCTRDDAPYIWQGVTDRYTVICAVCCVEGPYCDTEAEAIDAWDTRAPADAADKAVWNTLAEVGKAA